MPKYEYKCIDCESLVEVEASIYEFPVTPDCKQCEMPMVRIFSSFGLSFKGTGFYSTDKGHK
jgi:putative FmdB family regulatory protein